MFHPLLIMSGFGAPGQFDDAELERQIQDEYRRRQALQQAGHSAAFSALARARQPDYGTATNQHLSMLGADATSPYYARAPGVAASHHAAPYSRVSNPYGGLADARAYQQVARAPPPAPDSGPLAQLYAVQQRRQQQAVHQVGNYSASSYAPSPGGLAGSYGTPAPAFGAPSSAAAAGSLEQQRYGHSYGLPAPTSSAPAAGPPYGRMDTYSSSATGGTQDVSGGAYARPKGPPAPPAATPSMPSYAAKSPPALPPPSKLGKSNPSKAAIAKVSKTVAKTAAAAAAAAANKAAREPPLPPRVTTKDGKIVVGGKTTYYTGSVPLGLDDDKYWLSELQVFLRANFAEAFAATEEDIAAPMHGRNKPIALGQVGIRCRHCKSVNPAERGQQATSYPSLISGIYNSVQQMLRLHLDCCLSMPMEVRQRIEQLKISCSSRGGRKQYWIDSSRRLGLIDTAHGIHFGRDPYGPLPPLSGPSVNSKEGRRKRMLKATAEAAANKKAKEEPEPAPKVDNRPLVFDEDRPLISDYLYLTLQQMAPSTLMEADRVGCYKTRKVGFPGLACKHCVGQAGCGRYFPATEASLSQTTTSQTIMNHVRNCRRCPTEIRESLEIMKRNRMGPDGKRADKPKHGGRKVFFHRLWCRIQGLEIQEEPEDASPKTARRKSKKGGRKKRSLDSDVDTDEEGDIMSSDEETESEMESDDEDTTGDRKRRATSSKKKLVPAPWFEGCVRLTKTDDPHWLSEMECFARSDLVEVFSLDSLENLGGYQGRKEPEVGQVGVRCVFCKNLETLERPPGSVTFPESLATVSSKVTDMIRLHFPSCPSIPDDDRETFKSLRGFDAKVLSDDAQQYWLDASRDIGLANLPPGGNKPGAWGITFRRDPLQPSPADELDLEANSSSTPSNDKNALVTVDDRGLCTDQVLLLLRQVQPCRFKKSDRRAGPGYRGRDRAMGFPGLACRHCAGQNTLGRYFPVSAKNMTDCTSNSLQTHVQSCSYCPEPIRASLAYLGHRSILQKAELRGCWKKAFFKKVWDRLHVERNWTVNDDEGSDDFDEDVGRTAGMGEEDDEGGDGDNDSESEKEEVGESMNALIKAGKSS